MRLKVPFLGSALAGIAFLLPTVVLAAILPFLINAQPIRAKLLREIGAWTGAEVKVAGSISVQDLFSLSVEAQNVEIGAFKTVASIEGMKAQRIVARIAWFNLLSGNFSFDKIKIYGAVVKVRANGAGDATVLLSNLISGPQDTPLNAVLVSDSVIALRSERGKPYRRLQARNAMAYLAKAGRQLISSAHFVWKDKPLALSMRSAFRAPAAARVPLRVQLTSDLLTSKFDGGVRLAEPANAAGTLTLRSPDLAKAAKWLEMDIGVARVGGAVSASGALALSADEVSLTSGEIVLAGQTVQAALTLKRNTPVPQLEGVLAFNRFDLAALLAGGEGPAGSAALSPLRARIETDLRVSTRMLSWKGLDAGPAALTIASKPERLTADIAELVLLGGEMRGQIAVDLEGQGPHISARLTGEGLEAGALLRLMQQRDWLGGDANVNVEAEATLNDATPFLDVLTARARVNFPEGGQMRLDVPRLAASAVGETNGWGAFDATNETFNRLRFDLTLRDGQIGFANVVLAAAGRQMNGRGEIDLATRSLDWRFILLPGAAPEGDDRAVKSEGPNFAGSKISIRGPWASPTIRNDGAPSSLLLEKDQRTAAPLRSKSVSSSVADPKGFVNRRGF